MLVSGKYFLHVNYGNFTVSRNARPYQVSTEARNTQRRINRILKEVSVYTKIPVYVILKISQKTPAVVRARRLSMYIISRLNRHLTRGQIGKVFNTGHSNVNDAIRSINDLVRDDPAVEEQLELLIARCFDTRRKRVADEE